MSAQKYIAELIGTLALTLAVSISLLTEVPLATPLVAGLTLGLFVYTVGPVSGAQLNPAVTIGLACVKKMNLKDTVLYIICQVVGALVAMMVATWMTGKQAMLEAQKTIESGAVEALGAFFLMWGVSSVVWGKVSDAAGGVVIGGSLLLGIMMTAGLSFGVLNPAVAVGLGLWNCPFYLGAPIVGGIAAAFMYCYVQCEGKKKKK